MSALRRFLEYPAAFERRAAHVARHNGAYRAVVEKVVQSRALGDVSRSWYAAADTPERALELAAELALEDIDQGRQAVPPRAGQEGPQETA